MAVSPNDFPERIRRNNAYYDRFAENAVERSRSRDVGRAIEEFSARLPAGGMVLDIGCGIGEHMLMLRERGFRAIGLEPSGRMRKLATAAGLDVIDGAFETLDALALPPIDGVWCAASLLHVPSSWFNEALASIRRLLRPGTPLYLTVRLGKGASWDRWDDASGDAERFIQLFDERELADALVAAGLAPSSSWIEESTWGRPSRWISIIAIAGEAEGSKNT